MNRTQKIKHIIANPFGASLLFIISVFAIVSLLNLTKCYTFIYYDIFTFFAALLSSALIAKIARNHWLDFGLMLDRKTFSNIIVGLTFAALFFLIYIALSLIFGVKISVNKYIDYNALSSILLVLLFASIIEELIFRGIIFQLFLSRYNKAVIIIISSLLFAAVHSANLNITALAMLNIFLAGIVFSIMYYTTKSLWLPISFHFFWNSIQSLVCGLNVSGNSYLVSLLSVEVTSIQPMLFGADFGAEGGIIATLWLFVIIPIVLNFSRKR